MLAATQNVTLVLLLGISVLEISEAVKEILAIWGPLPTGDEVLRSETDNH